MKINPNNKRIRKDAIRSYKKYMAIYKERYYSRLGLNIVMGDRSGIYFRDMSGKNYINCHSNGGVFNLGHRHPEIIRTLENALAEVDIGNHHFISAYRAELSRVLVESLPDSCGKKFRVMYGSSGGEIVDLALKLARGTTGRKKIISIKGGYHGHTGLALSTGDEKYRDPFFSSQKGFLQIPFGDISAAEDALDDSVAAIILESIPATLGMRSFDLSYIQRIREWTRKNGILMIMDEIQTGLGRTGLFWAFEHYGICPDLIVTGKGLSGGIYPLTAVIYRADMEKIFQKDPFIHISTFGGSEAGCMVSLKVMQISAKPEFLAHVREMGEYFFHEWQELRKIYPYIGEIRQNGLFMGIVLDRPARVLFVLRELMKAGIFAVYANNDKKVIQFLPPLIVTLPEADEIMNRVSRALKNADSFLNKILFRLLSGRLER